jgi:PAS domain-containing protein
VVRGQLVEEAKLVTDLSTFGAAVLAHRPLANVPATGGERIALADPIQHLRILGNLDSVVALNSARTVAGQADQNITDLIGTQVALGGGGLIVSLLLAWALIATTRRQTAHFRSLVTSSSDLVIVLGAKGCRYASRSLCSMVGLPEAELLGNGF